ncbi:OmpA/MotB domain-containing protein [Paraburkholderia piptadeniae]|uniref:OmpA/MotB domain-containing protein n=1 Tax=Paraburkholderia piptadeniae TaxID=1701573 RepID=A0A1N7SID8_9BURK|nr:OmpA family protein [Paraburkholderia piptadeniae]SIT47116.1 OmpA/MotB domain-containing protein [Paraburkholderia piptadeniae]
MKKPILRSAALAVLAATCAATFAAPAFAGSIKSEAESLMPAAQRLADPYRRGVAEAYLEIAGRQDSQVLVSNVYNDAAKRALANARYLIDGSGQRQPMFRAKNWPTRDNWVQAIRAIEATNARASASSCKGESAGRLLALTDEVWKEQDETHGTRWVHGWESIERAKKLSEQVDDELNRCAPPPVDVPTAVEKPVALSTDALFDFDSATLTPNGKAALDTLASKLRQARAIDAVAVTGYTDRFGSVEHNRDLSSRRAQSVADALRERGVNAARFDVRGAGSVAPVATCPGPKTSAVIACLAPNRRVEVRVSALVAQPAAAQRQGPQPEQPQPQQP